VSGLMLTKSEDELIVACKAGDETAAASLVDALWPRVHAYAYRLCMSASDAEDITQETFLRAFKNLENYKPDGHFKAWLFRIATNLFLDQKKSSRNKDVVSSEIEREDVRGGTPESQENQRELIEALHKAMDELSKEQRIVVLLRAIEHMDYPEIAAMMGTKEATARWHMYEARRVLRQKLSRKFDLEGLADE
jgi:RNA polymerase sigma-70 factor, ECF subfamily